MEQKRIYMILIIIFLLGTIAHAVTHYQYDTQHRLVRVVHDDGTTIQYDYDASGNRTRRVATVIADVIVDGSVHFVDFAAVASRWLDNCTGPDWCGGADVDRSKEVNWGDVAILAQQWLQSVQ